MKKSSHQARKRRLGGGTEVRAGEAAPGRRSFSRWLWPAALILVVLVFYWNPLTNPETSVHWDAVDVHYCSQKYFADRAVHGELPFWTPYLFAGFPFLSDPQVGAWYPLNWPFFVSGITAWSIEAELALHAMIAALGAWLWIRRLTSSPGAAFAGALCYSFSDSLPSTART